MLDADNREPRNVVQVGQVPCVVDLLFDPGALYEEPSPKSQEKLGQQKGYTNDTTLPL